LIFTFKKNKIHITAKTMKVKIMRKRILKLFKKDTENNDLINQIYSNQDFTNKLDFNVDYLNKYLLECINSYLLAIYKQNSLLCEKYLTESFFKITHQEIEKDKKRFEYSNSNIKILKADFGKQIMESINYVSYITIKIEVVITYNRKNLFTGTIKKIKEIYTEDIVFNQKDNSWKINNILNQNFKLMEDDIIKF